MRESIAFLVKRATEERERPSQSDELLTTEQVIKKLKISRKTFFNMRKRRLITYTQINRCIRVHPKDLEAYMAAHFIKSK